jgi:DNA mismatch endonuclease, patch repair protein
LADIVSTEVRRRMMSGIRGKNTKPELVLRKLLHSQGFRFILHAKLAGRPDLVLPKWNAVIFVHGCFWHRHECRIFKWPSTRPAFWREKLNGNAKRDKENVARLLGAGWRVGIVWECSLRNAPLKSSLKVAKWIRSSQKAFEA